MLMSSAAMVTNTVITVSHAQGLPGPNPGSATFLALMWSTTAVMGVVCGLMGVQWGLNGTGKRGECYKGTRDVGQVDDWRSEKAPVECRRNS